MAKVRVPLNVGSITLTTSGALTPDAAGVITCTAAEASALTKPENFSPNGMLGLVTTAANGNSTFALPSVVSAITINGSAYTVTSGQITAVPAADAAAYIAGARQRPGCFELVSG